MNAGPPDGTPLASDRRVVEPISPDPHILARALAWFRRSVGRTLGFLALVVVLLAWGGTPSWRLAGLVSVYVVLLAAQFAIIRSASGPDQVQTRTLWIYLSGAVAQGFAFVLTGGLRSPLIPLLAMPVAGPGYLLRRAEDRRLAWTTVVVMFAAVVFAPASWTALPPLPAWICALVALSSLVMAIFSIREVLTMNLEVQERMQCCLDDMKEQQVVAATEQLRRLQSVGAKVAHELKNPLAAIKGLVQLVERSTDEPRAKERLAVVGAEILRMEEILRDYLSYSRPLEDLRIEEVELVALIADVRSVLSGRAEHASVDVSCSGEPLRIPGDSRRLKEALINLVSNAIEATPKGGAVEVVVAREPDHARITIHDTGAGMTPEHLTRVGQSFFTTRAGGTGLGVVLARNAIVQHGGGLRYTSKPGAGTTVTVELPLRSAEADTPAKAVVPATAGG